MKKHESNEQAPSEEVSEKLPSSPSGMDKEPSEEELEFYRNMSREEWETTVAQGKQKITDVVAEREKDEEKQRKEWERKIKALESIEPTGDIVEDAKSFLEAVNGNPGELDSHYNGAFAKGDHVGIMKYFKDLKRTAGLLSQPEREYVAKYFEKFDEVVKEIISACEFFGEKEKEE